MHIYLVRNLKIVFPQKSLIILVLILKFTLYLIFEETLASSISLKFLRKKSTKIYNSKFVNFDWNCSWNTQLKFLDTWVYFALLFPAKITFLNDDFFSTVQAISICNIIICLP